MNRRGFIGSIIALAAAPAIVRAESIMRIRPVFDVADWVAPPVDFAGLIRDMKFVEEPLDFAYQIGMQIRFPDGMSFAARAPAEARGRFINGGRYAWVSPATRQEVVQSLLNRAAQHYGIAL